MPEKQPSRLVMAAEVAGLISAAVIAVAAAPSANWDLSLMGVLMAFSLFSDLTAVSTPRVKISGSFLSLVLAMVFLGGPPAALIGVVTISIGWLRWHDAPHDLFLNLFTYAAFPLIGGIAFHEVISSAGISESSPAFYALVFGLFQFSLALNFLMISGLDSLAEHTSFKAKFKVLPPVLPSELASGMMAVGVAFIYEEVGIAAIALFGIVLVMFQYLLGQLLLSQQRAEDLESRTKQLVSFQVGVLGALMKTLDLRDEMTARHCASVARYSRAIAKAAGMSQTDQELVHIAGLMHDIGKFILPDHILKANVPLTDDDWNLIRMHPQQGANVVSSLEGYGPVAKIVLAHHERIDGKGYPRGLKGDDIPEMSRIISVADTYDVMTARDSYKDPVSSFEAIQELRRVSGSQLDERFVKVFVEEVMEGKDLTFRHGEDADFDVELALEERIEAVEEQSGRFLVGGARVG